MTAGANGGEMELDMDVDALKDAIGKAYPSIDDGAREMLCDKLDRIHNLAYKSLAGAPRTDLRELVNAFENACANKWQFANVSGLSDQSKDELSDIASKHKDTLLAAIDALTEASKKEQK